MAKKITIELTEPQARIVLTAVEEWFRLRMGQTDTLGLAYDLAFDGYDRSKDTDGKGFDRCIQCRDHINEVLKCAFRIAWPEYGTPRKKLPGVDVAGDIWSALRYELNQKDGIWGPAEPIQLGEEPLPEITVEEVDHDS